MGMTLARQGSPEELRRRGSLLLSIGIHVGLAAAAWHGLHSTLERTEPREVVVSLLSLTSDAAPAPAPAQALPQPPVAAPPLRTAVPASPVPQAMPVAPATTVPHETPVTAPTPAPTALTSTPAPEVRNVPAAVAVAPAAPTAPATPATPAVAPAVTPAARGPVMVSGVEYLTPPKVDYPIAARRAGLEGKVMLRLLIDEKGQPQRADIQQSSGHARLDEAARTAALHALFKPHLEDGQPMPVYALVPISFSLR